MKNSITSQLPDTKPIYLAILVNILICVDSLFSRKKIILLSNQKLKQVGLSYGLEVRIRIDFTMRLDHHQPGILSSSANNNIGTL